MSEDQAKRAPSMKAALNDAYIKRLKLTEPPLHYDEKGFLVFGSDPNCKSYILWDSSRDAPPGFGVRVSKKKTYIIRRKVNGKSIMPTVGNFADFKDIHEARKKAGAMALRMVETGRNPNEMDRMESAAELTLGQAMSAYREHIVTRTQKPAKEQTLRVFDRAARKHEAWGWNKRKVREIPTDDIEAKFIEGKAFPTANEQAFRWPTAAVRWCIEKEKLVASAERRNPALTANPFDILALHDQYRTKEQILKDRDERGVSNPLTPSATLGPFLEAAWSKKNENDNETGVHFLILMLLWGCRKSEHAQCVWNEHLSDYGDAGVGRKMTSHVCLTDSADYGQHVFFFGTKNGRSHRLPLGPMALELLNRRQVSAAEESERRGFAGKSRQFVFPARNRNSKTGHYRDAKELLERLKAEIGLARLTPHDLRRSFGAVMTDIEVPESIQSRFFNHSSGNVTATYNKAEWALLKKWMARIEQAILAKAPNIYNALKPVDWPMLPAPAPHVCRPVKPRTGRPRKDAEELKAGEAEEV